MTGPLLIRDGRPMPHGWLRTVALLIVTGLTAAGAVVAGGGPEAVAPAPAGTTTPATPEAGLDARLKELEREIAALRAEIERLESPGAAPGAAELEARIDALSKEIERLRIGAAASPEAEASVGGMGPAASKIYNARHGVSIGGYGEVVYSRPSDRLDDGTPSGLPATADLLRAVLYFGYKFNDRLLFNSEIEVEHAVAGDGEPGEVDAEFAYVDFRARRSIGVRGGLLLMPVGFLNELHEPPVFYGVFRPAVERFIIPTTWREIGAGAYGEAGPVSWKAYLVTGLNAAGFSAAEGFREGTGEGAEVVAQDAALAARVDWVPVQGLLFGVSVFSGDSAQDNSGLDGARMTVWEAHGEWNSHGVHLRGLCVRTTLEDAAEVSALVGQTIGSRMDGWYAEAAWNVLALRGNPAREVSPFVRYEAFDTQAQVAPGFAADPSNDRMVVTWGIHYRPIPNLAIKVDYQDERNRAGTGLDSLNVGLGWLF